MKMKTAVLLLLVFSHLLPHRWKSQQEIKEDLAADGIRLSALDCIAVQVGKMKIAHGKLSEALGRCRKYRAKNNHFRGLTKMVRQAHAYCLQ